MSPGTVGQPPGTSHEQSATQVSSQCGEGSLTQDLSGVQPECVVQLQSSSHLGGKQRVSVQARPSVQSMSPPQLQPRWPPQSGMFSRQLQWRVSQTQFGLAAAQPGPGTQAHSTPPLPASVVHGSTGFWQLQPVLGSQSHS